MIKKGEIFDIYERQIGTSEWRYIGEEPVTSIRRIGFSPIGDIEYWIYIGHRFKFRANMCSKIHLRTLNLNNDMEYEAINK